MGFDIATLGIDVAIVVALVVVIDFVKSKVDGLHLWKWWFVVVLGSGCVAGLATELFAETTNLWLVVRSAFLFSAGMVLVKNAYEQLRKAVIK